MRTRIVMLLGAVLAVTACSAVSESTTSTSTTTTIPSSTTTTTEPTTTIQPTTTTTLTTTTTTQAIDVFFEGGQVVGEGRFSFAVGEEVSVWVLSDTVEEIHVHGYDVFFEAEAGVPIEVALVADVPGIFEVELEATHTLLFELEVTS